MGAVKLVIAAVPQELPLRQQEPTLGVQDHSVARQGAGEDEDRDTPNDGLNPSGLQSEDETMSSVTIVDGLWGTKASMLAYDTILLPPGVRNGDIRVTFEILSEVKEKEYDANFKAVVKEKDRGDRKFKLVNMQCC